MQGQSGVGQCLRDLELLRTYCASDVSSNRSKDSCVRYVFSSSIVKM